MKCRPLYGSAYLTAPNQKESHQSASGVLVGEHKVRHLTCRPRHPGRSHVPKESEAHQGTENQQNDLFAQA